MILFSFIPFILGFVGLVVAQDQRLSAVKRAFQKANVSVYINSDGTVIDSNFFYQISETINLSFNPEVLLEVTFPEPSGEPITLHPGVQLTINGKSSSCNFKFHNHNAHGLPSETAGPPAFSIVGHTRCPGPFVIVLVDPDALTPQNPAISQLRHFLGGDFFCANPNSKHWAPLTNTTPAVTEFLRPKPFVGYDAHRYEQLSQLLPKVILIPK